MREVIIRVIFSNVMFRWVWGSVGNGCMLLLYGIGLEKGLSVFFGFCSGDLLGCVLEFDVLWFKIGG